MSVAKRQLRFRSLWICPFHDGQIQGRGEPRSVGAVLAVDQNRLCGSFHEGNQSDRLRARQFVSRRHAEVDVDNPEVIGLFHLCVVPGLSFVFAAQIDDRPYFVGRNIL